MPYVDCYLAPVPVTNRAAYEKLAEISEVVLRECGALRVTECWLDETGPEASTFHGTDARIESEQYKTFRQAAGAQKGETVVISFVEWPDKAARDSGMEKFTSDPRTQFDSEPPAFDGQRLIAGGFKPMPSAAGKA
jgi:uncharacterized protein YbaA (DUF1428 family)